jgi:general stress protein 26
MTSSTKSRSLSDVTSDFRFAMLVTATSGAVSSRPLTVLETEGQTLRFLIDAEARWATAADGQPVHLAFADPKSNAFASVTGTGRVVADRALIERLYGPEADVFFEGKDDPRVRVLEVTATEGEWWDGPSGRVGEAVAMVRAKVTGDPDKVGDSGDIDLR